MWAGGLLKKWVESSFFFFFFRKRLVTGLVKSCPVGKLGWYFFYGLKQVCIESETER